MNKNTSQWSLELHLFVSCNQMLATDTRAKQNHWKHTVKINRLNGIYMNKHYFIVICKLGDTQPLYHKIYEKHMYLFWRESQFLSIYSATQNLHTLKKEWILCVCEKLFLVFYIQKQISSNVSLKVYTSTFSTFMILEDEVIVLFLGWADMSYSC